MGISSKLMLSTAIFLLAISCSQRPTTALQAAGGASRLTETGTFLGAKAVRIAYKIVRSPQPKAFILLLQGLGEAYLGNDELINDFVSRDISVFIMDHRGMGLSDRLIADRMVGYVDDFSYYAEDAETFIRNFVQKESGQEKLLLFGHSTGGLVASQLLARNPGMFASAVLNAPLMTLKTGVLPNAVAKLVANLAELIGKGTSYPPGCGPWVADKVDFEGNQITHSPERFNKLRDLKIQNPQIQLGDPSFAWLGRALSAASQVPTLAAAIDTPMLLVQAGLDDLVTPEGHQTFCSAAKHCRIFRLPEAYHSTFRETDAIRAQLFEEVFSHFAEAGVVASNPAQGARDARAEANAAATESATQSDSPDASTTETTPSSASVKTNGGESVEGRR